MKKTTTVLFLLFCLLLPSVSLVRAQTVANQADVFAQIRKEGMDNSQIMRTLHFLTDVYGPRLTGSPNMKKANEWTRKQLQDFGRLLRDKRNQAGFSRVQPMVQPAS